MIWNLSMVLILAIVIFIYFKDNPLKHARCYRTRCFWNWFPMGLTYAFLYMGRYNLTVSKNALGDLMTKQDFGLIFAAGTIVYAFSFLINGPLTDRIGGKKAILIGATGSAIMNALMGVALYFILVHNVSLNLRITFSILYALNMYFQSYGAVAIVKLNAHWFHVKERGVFSGIFGTLISLGVYFAYDWGQSIVDATLVNPPQNLGFFQNILRSVLGSNNSSVDQTWFVFFIPAVILAILVVIEFFLLKDTPKEAGLEDFDTADASSGEMDIKFSAFQIMKKVITNPIILTIAFIEFCSGVIRQSIMQWYFIFAKDVGLSGNELFFKEHWGLLLCYAGIIGGFFTGAVSDKLFQSRRGPSAVLTYSMMFVGAIVMAIFLFKNQYVLGATVIFMSLCVIGIHGILSGTATMDFGGRKGAGTAVGMIDGFVYLGTAVQSISLGYITTWNWTFWPIFIIPFTLIGIILAARIWHALPNAVSKKSH